MKIYLAADHAGYELKEDIKKNLAGKGYDVVDKGAGQLNAQDDYPDFMRLAAVAVAGDVGSMGILFGGSGQGEAIVANRVPGIRAVVFYGSKKAKKEIDVNGTVGDDEFDIVRLERKHNDANILSIGARFVSADDARQAVLVWLETKFSGEERHARRIKKIDSA
jgi:ribose 5-phosphate isomerase B